MYTHPFRWGTFLSGAFFGLVLLGWLAVTTNALSIEQLSVIGPIALIGVGVVGVAATFRKQK